MMSPLSRTLALSTLLAAAGSGCIVYDYPCKDGHRGGGAGDGGSLFDGEDTGGGGSLLDGDTGAGDDTADEGDTGGTTDTGDEAPPEPPTFTLQPAEVVQGEAVVAELLADDDTWDHTAIVDVTLGPGLVLCSLDRTETGATVAYGAWGDTEPGAVAVDVDLGEAGTVSVAGGITVVPPGGIVTPDPTVDPCTTLD